MELSWKGKWDSRSKCTIEEGVIGIKFEQEFLLQAPWVR
jgi:hypothetical protein